MITVSAECYGETLVKTTEIHGELRLALQWELKSRGHSPGYWIGCETGTDVLFAKGNSVKEGNFSDSLLEAFSLMNVLHELESV